MTFFYKRFVFSVLLLITAISYSQLPTEITPENGWYLEWEDEFDYPNEQLDDHWISQNGPTGGGLVTCSRWRENAVVADGILELQIRKEDRGGQEWTCGSIWTKSNDFRYGYYEARYRYARATGTNNSFWLFPYSKGDAGHDKIELDINEGRYPNAIKTNIHNWTPGDGEVHPLQTYYYVGSEEPVNAYTHELVAPVNTTKLRFSSTHAPHFHIGEFRAYAPNLEGYPEDATSETADTDVTGLVNHVRNVATTFDSSGFFPVEGRSTEIENIGDGIVKNIGHSWIAPANGDEWFEVTFDESKEIGCIQFTNGWTDDDGETWNALIDNYIIEYWNGVEWIQLVNYDRLGDANLGDEYHTYGLLWTPEKHIFYLDGEEIRNDDNPAYVQNNPFVDGYWVDVENHGKTQILLSLAVIDSEYLSGPIVEDELDGTSMKIDWVRYHKNDDLVLSTIENSIGSKAVKIYPNPVVETLSITNIETFDTIQVIDAQGKSVFQQSINGDEPIDVSNLKSGVYYLSLHGKNIDSFFDKFVKK